MSTPQICVIGASGLVGANITRAALARGYAVAGTLRDSADPEKAGALRALPNAGNLTLYSGDMSIPGAFDEALAGADCVYIASLIPTYFAADGTPARELDDERGYEEIVRPTLDGCLNILRSAAAAGVGNAVICSSTSSTNPVPPVANKNEVDHWSDEQEQYRAKKYTSAAKTVMEKAAMAYAEEHGIRLCILLPTMMLGPPVLPAHRKAGFGAMIDRLLAGEKPRHESVPNDSMSMIHLDDLANLFLACFENESAKGRYFGVYDSWHWQDIYDCLAGLIPEAPMPARLGEPRAEATSFDFTRRDSLGVTLRDVPSMLEEMVAWHRAHPLP